MKKPDIVYCKRIIPNSDKVGIDKYVNGFGKNNPILEVDEEIADRIVFFDDMIDALISANNVFETYFDFDEVAEDHKGEMEGLATVHSRIKQALTKAGVQI